MSDSKTDWLKTDVVCEGPLPVEEFENYQKANTLGRIYFPNGKVHTPGESIVGHDLSPYSLNLQKLHGSIGKWIMNEQSVLSLGLVGIVAMGDTVRRPGYVTTPTTRKKYNFFGLEFGPDTLKVERVPIQPEYAEFMIITANNPTPLPEKALDYVSRRTSQIAAFETRYRDIRLHVRGIEQVLTGLSKKGESPVNIDDATFDAFEKGVPIIFNHELKYITETTGIENYNSLVPVWYKSDNQLFGKIA